eukprot:4064783-Prorocentrum_lima.AAC.1
MRKCINYGCQTSVDILTMTQRDIMPTINLSRMSMAKELRRQVTRVPTTLVGLANWLEEYVHKLELGMRPGSLMEPRAILTVVRDMMGT